MAGDIDWAYNEFTGELFTIKEFNAAHHDIKLAPVQGLCFFGKNPQLWQEQIFVAHIFKHADYCRPISGLTQLSLAPRAAVDKVSHVEVTRVGEGKRMSTSSIATDVDKVVLITGASCGIGRSIALALSEEGMHLCPVGRDGEALGRIVIQVRSATLHFVFCHNWAHMGTD
jgi:hypothetical protein